MSFLRHVVFCSPIFQHHPGISRRLNHGNENKKLAVAGPTGPNSKRLPRSRAWCFRTSCTRRRLWETVMFSYIFIYFCISSRFQRHPNIRIPIIFYQTAPTESNIHIITIHYIPLQSCLRGDEEQIMIEPWDVERKPSQLCLAVRGIFV